MGQKKPQDKKENIIERRRRNYDKLVEQIPNLSFKHRHARGLMAATLLMSDLVSLFLTFGVAIWLNYSITGVEISYQSRNLMLIVPLFLLVYAWNGLYPGVGLSPVVEMKHLMSATNFVFLLLIASTFWERTFTGFSRLLLVEAWLIALVLVQLDRWIVRILGKKLDYWGEPVAIIGSGPQGQHILEYLKNHIRLGMRPVLIIDGNADYKNTPLVVINQSNIRTLLLVTPEISEEMHRRIIFDQRFGYYRRRGEKSIPRLILISSLGWVGSLGITPLDMDGLLGLEVRQNLLNKWPILFKRMIDLTLTISGGILFSPFIFLIILFIILDTKGGIFYSQERVGRDGKIFKMWKFRTMITDAEKVLQSILNSNPDLMKEWEENQKFKNDPRITRVGKFLRKYSLDEIPQLINVFKGEMSLVGPRPFFPSQLENFSEWIMFYQRVNPGMTGMWQVRGRNEISVIGKERQRLDEYYIRNWSVWLDVYILLRTVQVVFSKEGAY